MNISLRVRVAFLALTVMIFVALDAVLAIYIINWARWASVLMFIFLVFFNFSFALLLAKRTLSLFVKPYELPRLSNLNTKPKVAVLYTTMNDVVPESLSAITQTYPADVYVLDDSTDSEKRKIVDEIAQEKGFTVLRREHRKGFKAGAINNWINLHGRNYDYIVLLDADSYLPPDWVGEALRYAEHPMNSNTSIFQGLINIWNLDNRFVRTLAPLHVVGQDEWEKRLANHLNAVFCYGHNVLVRMSHLREIGGFVEGYVSEDFATATKLAERGYNSRFIPIHTYEALPENIRGFIKRQNKWTRGSMEFLTFARQPHLSFMQRLLLLQTPTGHFSYIIVMITILLAIFGYNSTTAQLTAFAMNLIGSNFLYVLAIPIFQYVIITSIISGALLSIKLHQLGVSSRAFVKYQLLSKAIGAIMLPYEVSTIAKYSINRRLAFNVTPKSEKALSFKETIVIAKGTLVLIVLLIAGLAIFNPLGFFYNLTWLAPFVVSPLIIYLSSKANKPRTNESAIDPPATMTNGGYPVTISSTSSQPESVHTYLSLYGHRD